ncbi:MAG: Omp28-related outer membrane protein, partial [Flavobacteriales bacterium]|nr:Omp28-related outer membrane protein [Flavobacteriales bacterium]
MKKSLLLTALTAFGLGSYAQTFVSTSPENRNVVLEEFTGIYCTFCPDGHKRAQELHDAYPNDVVLINVHAGGYAAPSGNDPDFRTNFGSAIANQSDLCGYPAGTVNREHFPNYFQTDNNGNPCGTNPTAQSRGTWATTGPIVMGESSPVNVAGQATLDLSTGKLTVVVEAYYTANAPTNSNKIHVAVMQNGVIGPQTGSSANPAQVNPDGTYTHNHMLRHLLTGQWGQAISTTTMGSFFTDSYVWDVPADINGVPLDLNNLEVAVFVSEGNQYIFTGQMAELSVVSPNAYDALPAAIDVPEFVCESEVAPKVTIQNMGNETMTSLTINYNVNGGPVQTYNWTGSLNTAQSEVVTLPTMSFTHLPTNTVWVATNNPNGQNDQVPANNVSTKEFQPSKNSGTTIEVNITPDNYGSETTWKVLGPNGSVIQSGGPYTDNNNTPVSVTISGLSNGCHTFVIEDEYGDGICCSYGNGSYSVTSNGQTLYTGGEFGSMEEKTFNVGGTNSVEDLELVSNIAV